MASFITRNPPVASRFTPFIPFPLSSIGEGPTIFIRQETENGSPGAGLRLRDKDNGEERREDCTLRRTAGCSDWSEDDPNRRECPFKPLSWAAGKPRRPLITMRCLGLRPPGAAGHVCGEMLLLGGRQRVFALLLVGGW